MYDFGKRGPHVCFESRLYGVEDPAAWGREYAAQRGRVLCEPCQGEGCERCAGVGELNPDGTRIVIAA